LGVGRFLMPHFVMSSGVETSLIINPKTEYYPNVDQAIARESQLKKWSRAKKIALINRVNPSWLDLGMDVLQER
jgi:predicted GIY-YIG superfamily endonuclease